MKCPNCGAETPDGKKFCGDCGSPLDAVEGLSAKWQRRLAQQTASIIVLISVLLVILGLGFNNAGEDLRNIQSLDSDLYLVGSALVHLAWLFGLFGIAGFFVAGLAYLLSLPIPKKEKEKGLVPVPKTPN